MESSVENGDLRAAEEVLCDTDALPWQLRGREHGHVIGNDG